MINAPDYIAEQALLSASMMQRESMGFDVLSLDASPVIRAGRWHGAALNHGNAIAYCKALTGGDVVASIDTEHDGIPMIDVVFVLASGGEHVLSVWTESGAMYGEW